MNRPFTVVAIVLFILALVFHFAALAGGFLIVLIAAAGLLLAIGVLIDR